MPRSLKRYHSRDEALHRAKLGIKSDEQQHEEEQARPDWRARQLENRRWISEESQARPGSGHFGYRFLLFVRHKAYHREYHEAREHAGGRVDGTDNQRVLVDIVGKFIVTAEGYQSAEPKTIREEDLRHCIDPYLRISFYVFPQIYTRNILKTFS